MRCTLCSAEEAFRRPGRVRNNPALEIWECGECGLVFLSSQDHVGTGFYENSGMHDGERPTDEWMKSTAMDDRRRLEQLSPALTNRRLLDFGCGNGAFLMMARDICSEVAGVELEKKLQVHFQKNELLVYESIEQVKGEYDWITAFHVVEHLADPVAILRKMSVHLKSGSGRIFLEVPSSSDALLTLYNCEAFRNFTYWSCHLYLYNDSTIRRLAKRAGLQVEMVKQVQRYPLSNHLYWLSEGKPGGHERWSLLDTPEILTAYQNSLAAIGACDTITAVLYS